MLISPAQPLTAESLEHLPGFVATQVLRVAQTHNKMTWEYHHEHLPFQAFSPWLFLDELFWLYLRGSEWWLTYGETGTSLVAAAQEGRAADDTDIWLVTNIYYEMKGDASIFRSRLSHPAPELPSPWHIADQVYRFIDPNKLIVWRITFDLDKGGKQAALPASAPQTDPALRAIVLPPPEQELSFVP